MLLFFQMSILDEIIIMKQKNKNDNRKHNSI